MARTALSLKMSRVSIPETTPCISSLWEVKLRPMAQWCVSVPSALVLPATATVRGPSPPRQVPMPRAYVLPNCSRTGLKRITVRPVG